MRGNVPYQILVTLPRRLSKDTSIHGIIILLKQQPLPFKYQKYKYKMALDNGNMNKE